MKTYPIWIIAFACTSFGADAPAAPPPPSKIERACEDALVTSLRHEIELDQKLRDLWKQVSDLNSAPGNDPKKALKDWMTPAQLDQFNMLTMQMRYITFSIYGEVTKRREIRAVESLAKAANISDDLYAGSIAVGNVNGDAARMNDEINAKLAAAGLSLWNAELTNVVKLQYVTDAQTVAIDNQFIPKVKIAKSIGPRSATDDIGFLFDDDVKNTVAFKFFNARLDDEIKKGNPDATAIRDYLAGWNTK